MNFKKNILFYFLLIIILSAFSPSFLKLIHLANQELNIGFDLIKTTPLLSPPYISGSMNDATDPAMINGIFVYVLKGKDSLLNYNINCISDNQLVVKDDNIVIKKEKGCANIKIIPNGVGYSNINITVIAGKEQKSLIIRYASSFSEKDNVPVHWHYGTTDASAGIAINDSIMVVGDDENNKLIVYNRFYSGMPINSFDYSNLLNLTDGDIGSFKEVDCEASARSPYNPHRIYWLGSMSNGGKNSKEEINRNRLFATDIYETDLKLKFEFKGFVNTLRKNIVNWGDENGLQFNKAAQAGINPKQPIGFNFEGMCFGPDSSSLYLALRAPLFKINDQQNAIIVPLLNFEKWFNEGHPTSNPKFGKPIMLNLDHRGIRDIIRLKNGQYILIAGHCDENRNSNLYSWTGYGKDEPKILDQFNLNNLNAEGIIPFIDSNGNITLEIISDNGSSIYYNDSSVGKYLRPEYKKFRSDLFQIK